MFFRCLAVLKFKNTKLNSKCLLTITALVGLNITTFEAHAREVEVAVRYGVTPVGDGTARLEDGEFLYMMPDSTIVYYDYGSGAISGLLVRSNIDGTTSTLISSNIHEFYSLTTDGGAHIAYIDNNTQNLWRMDATTGVSTLIAEEAYDIFAHGVGGDILYSTWSYDLGKYGLTFGNAEGATNLFYENDEFNGITLYESSPYSSFVREDGTALFTLDTYPYNTIIKGSGSGMTVIYGGIAEAEPFYISPYSNDGYLTLLNAPEEQYGFHLNPVDGGYNLITGVGVNLSDYLLTADNGDIYFSGQNGIYFYDADAESDTFSLLIDGSASTWNSFPVGVTSRGDLIYRTQNGSGVDSINIYYTNTGDSISLLSEGDMAGDETVTSLFGNYDYSYINNNVVLENISFNNDMVAVYGILDNNYNNTVIFRIAVYPETGGTFVWEDRCGLDGNWHATCNTDENNWTDVATGEMATTIPGYMGDEHVIITNADVNIVDDAVHVTSLTTTGSLSVENNLTLDKASLIHDLTLAADLETGGLLTLTGGTVWKSGKISGTGSIHQPHGIHLFHIDTGEQILNLETSISIDGSIIHSSGTLNLNGSSANVVVGIDGSYEISEGSVIDTANDPSFLNYGLVRKYASTAATIDAHIENKPGATVQIDEGSLVFRDPSNWSGKLLIENSAEAIFKSSVFNLSYEDSFVVSGKGELKMENAEVFLLGNGFFSYFELSPSLGHPENSEDFFDVNGGVSIGHGTNISGNGIYYNRGFTFVEGGTVHTEIINDSGNGDPGDIGYIYAGLSLISGTISGNIENLGVVKLTGGTIVSEFLNNGYLYLGEIDDGLALDTSGLKLTNEHVLIKYGNSSQTLGALTNTGTIHIRKGDLFVENSIALDDGTIEVEALASLTFIPIDQPMTIGQSIKIMGEGEVSIKGEILSGTELSGESPTFNSILNTSGLSLENVQVSDLSISTKESGFAAFSNTSLINVGMSISDSAYLYFNDENMVSGDSRFNIYNNTRMIFESGESNLDLTAFVVQGEIKVMDSATASFEPLPESSSAPFKGIIDFISSIRPIELVSGSWIVEKGANLNLSDGEYTRGIQKIGSNASLTMGGGTGTQNPLINDRAYLGLDSFGLEETRMIISGKLVVDGMPLTIVGDKEGSEGPANAYFGIGTRISVLATGGTIELRNGAELNLHYNPTNTNEFGALFGGTITGNGFLNGTLINTENTSPGQSSGILTINGNYAQTETGVLEIEVFGAETGAEYDQLVVNGIAVLGGTLRIKPVGIIPVETVIKPILADSVDGNFDRVIVEAKSARSTYTVTTSDTGIQLSPATLDVSTFAEWQSSLFSESDISDPTIGLTTSDPDGDHISNLLEYAMDLNPWVKNNNPVNLEFELDEVAGFDGVTVTFPWAKDMTDVDYVIQISPDMLAWTDLASTVQETIDEGTHNLLTIKAVINPPAEERLFVQVVVVEVP